jgi:hypothetical protein
MVRKRLSRRGVTLVELMVAPELELADSPLLPPPAPLHAAMTT